MADANINLNATDNTRAAFLGVKNKLGELGKHAADAGKQMTRAFNSRAIATALGLNLQNISQQIARFATGMSKTLETAYGAMAASSEILADASIANIRDQASEETKFKLMLLERERILARIAKGQTSAEFQPQHSVMAMTLKTLGLPKMFDAEKATNEMADSNKMVARVIELEKQLRDLGNTHQNVIENTLKDHRSLEEAALKVTHQLHEVGIASDYAFVTSAGPRSIKEMTGDLSGLTSELRTIDSTLSALREKSLVGDEDMIQVQAKINEMLNQRAILLKGVVNVSTQILAESKKNEKVAAEAANILSDGFEDAIFNGEKLSKVMSQLGKDIARMIFRNLITNPLAESLTGGIKKLGFFANGGSPPVGRASIVGERGPELFVPSTAGTIIPNHKLGGGGGGSTYYIDARGADQTGLARLEGMIRQTQASIAPISLGAVMNARARGGAF